jgi:hypothetical protein
MDVPGDNRGAEPLLLAFVTILGASSFQAMLPAIVVSGIILIYCLPPRTKASFRVA